MTSVDWRARVSQPRYNVLLEEDVWVPLRDGVRLCVDVYRPRAEGRFPALLSWSSYGKDSQTLPTNPRFQPSDYVRGTGGHECGEQSYFVTRGYVQVIPDIRGVGKSEGDFVGYSGRDGYDVVEWIAAQPWCNGNVGMAGMSSFGLSQFPIAAERPPHLRAIFPFEAVTDWYRHSYYHGGVFSYLFWLHLGGLMPIRRKPEPLSAREFTADELRKRVEALQADPDIRCTPYLYLLTLCPLANPSLFDVMLHRYDGPFYRSMSASSQLAAIDIPSYVGSRWNGWAVHLGGAFEAWEGLGTPPARRKLLMVPSDNYGGMDRPFHEIQDVCLRWYDHWLKGVDTGIMDEPPILIFVQGINRWRYEEEWPLRATCWTKFYLRSPGRLSVAPPEDAEPPQTFVSDPWADPNQGFRRADVLARADPVPRAVYETEPLAESVEVTGPLALYWHAAIESAPAQARSWKASELEALAPLSNDTDWYLKLIDVDVDGAQRCVAEGWLKASHHEVDAERSEAYAPYHPHTRSLPIAPGEVVLYASDLRMTSNVFLMGHRIRLEIAGQDQVQALWYHLPHMARVTHTVFSTGERPSYVLLPVIPRGYTGAGEPASPPAGPFRIPKYRRGE